MEAGWTWVAVVGVLTSAMSLYYYMGIVVQMYFKDSEENTPIPLRSPVLGATLIFCAVMTVILGIFPGPVDRQVVGRKLELESLRRWQIVDENPPRHDLAAADFDAVESAHGLEPSRDRLHPRRGDQDTAGSGVPLEPGLALRVRALLVEDLTCLPAVHGGVRNGHPRSSTTSMTRSREAGETGTRWSGPTCCPRGSAASVVPAPPATCSTPRSIGSGARRSGAGRQRGERPG